MTPLFSVTEMRDAGVEIILYPLSAARAMAKASAGVYQKIKKQGTQKNQTHNMQTRDELYETLNYKKYEEKIDRILEEKKERE
jgi:methylisocitrate lyase